MHVPQPRLSGRARYRRVAFKNAAPAVWRSQRNSPSWVFEIGFDESLMLPLTERNKKESSLMTRLGLFKIKVHFLHRLSLKKNVIYYFKILRRVDIKALRTEEAFWNSDVV